MPACLTAYVPYVPACLRLLRAYLFFTCFTCHDFYMPDLPSFFNVNYIFSFFHVPCVPSRFVWLICLPFSCVLRTLTLLICLMHLYYLGDFGAFIFLSALVAFKRIPDPIKDWKLHYERVASIVLMKRTYWKKFLEAQNIFKSLQVQSGREKMRTLS